MVIRSLVPELGPSSCIQKRTQSFQNWNSSFFEKKRLEATYRFGPDILSYCRSQCPRGLRHRSAAARLLRSWVRIPPGAWMYVCCECFVLSGRGLCDKLITRPEESYRLWCVVVCDLENLKNEKAMTRVGSQRHSKKKKNTKRLVVSGQSPSD